jgi:hypothetical protein
MPVTVSRRRNLGPVTCNGSLSLLSAASTLVAYYMRAIFYHWDNWGIFGNGEMEGCGVGEVLCSMDVIDEIIHFVGNIPQILSQHINYKHIYKSYCLILLPNRSS